MTFQIAFCDMALVYQLLNQMNAIVIGFSIRPYLMVWFHSILSRVFFLTTHQPFMGYLIQKFDTNNWHAAIKF